MRFFTPAELDTYLREALSTWGAASLYYRKRDNFTTISGQAFYDLSTLIPSLTPSTTDRELASQLEYTLIEPQTSDWSTWTGTEQFSLPSIQSTIQRARDRFLLEAGIILSVTEIPTASPPISRVSFPEEIIDIRRIASKSTTNQYRTLSREDELTLGAYSSNWNIASVSSTQQPNFYSLVSEPSLTLQLAPVAVDIATLQLLYISLGEELNLALEVNLGILEAFIWAIKYGALLELFGPRSQAHDPIRANYCQMRWDEAISLAKIYPSILNAEVNGVQINISSISDLDNYVWNWQNSSGVPTQLGVASWNQVALSPVPNSAEISIILDYICNPPLPVADDDTLQIDGSLLGIIYDYSRHLAQFKRGGQEFLSSRQGYDRLVQAASLHNARLRAQSRLFSSLVDTTANTKVQHPIAMEDPSSSPSSQKGVA